MRQFEGQEYRLDRGFEGMLWVNYFNPYFDDCRDWACGAAWWRSYYYRG